MNSSTAARGGFHFQVEPPQYRRRNNPQGGDATPAAGVGVGVGVGDRRNGPLYAAAAADDRGRRRYQYSNEGRHAAVAAATTTTSEGIPREGILGARGNNHRGEYHPQARARDHAQRQHDPDLRGSDRYVVGGDHRREHNRPLFSGGRGGEYDRGGGGGRDRAAYFDQSDERDDDFELGGTTMDDGRDEGLLGGNYPTQPLLFPSPLLPHLLRRNLSPAQAYLLAATVVAVVLFVAGGGFHPSAMMPHALMDSALDLAASAIPGASHFIDSSRMRVGGVVEGEDDVPIDRPDFVYEHPYVSSSYYTSTKSIKTLLANEEIQVTRNLREEAEEAAGMPSVREVKTRLAIVRPFCEFDAEALPTTFTCWNALSPCKAASADIGDEDYDDDGDFELGLTGELVAYKNNTAGKDLYDDARERHFFDLVGSDAMKNAKADVFLFYSQTFAENDVAIKAVDTIIDQFFEPGGWSQCFGNIYAIEANIPQELDLYIPSAQEELYNWVNGPNRQFEAAFRIIQSGEWGEYDGFYLMEGDSVPIKAHWLDVVLSEIEVNRPFAILGAQYDGDKWDNFYEKIPISLLHHTNGNAIYNTSHPLLERLVGQLEVEAPCPYNSIPYDYRMSQMWVEGTLGIVPDLAPKIMLNEEGENITLSNNLDMFKKWADIWEREDPFKYTPVIHNYAATNLIPRHLGPEYIIHGAKLYSPWDPTKSEVTLVISEWFFDRSFHLISSLDDKNHPFSEVVVMVPPVAGSHDDYDQMSDVPVRTQHRGAPDFMDLCEADVKTDWFMLTNSYHHVARHVDLMFTPGTFKPVIPFTPATYPFCFKFPYCKETINLAQRFNPGHDKVVLDMDMLYNTEARDAFCKIWKEENGEEGEDLYKHQQRRLMFRKKIIGPPGPTGTSYFAYLMREKKDGMYKMTDRSLYGARPPFVKVFAKEEKLDGMSEDELAKRVGMTLLDNSTDCNCGTYETEEECSGSGIGCIWRPLFESCHPPELIDGGEPICVTSEAPTMTPTVSLQFEDTDSPTVDAAAADSAEEGSVSESDPWYTSMFKSREHEGDPTSETNSTDPTIVADDDDAIIEPNEPVRGRNLEGKTLDSWYETDLSAEQRMERPDESRRKLEADFLTEAQDAWYETDLSAEQRMDISDRPRSKPEVEPLAETQDPWYGADLGAEQRMVTSDEARSKLEVESLAETQDPWYELDPHVDQTVDSSDEPNISSEPQADTNLPMKTCNPWDPSIVPRYPTSSSTWAGASLDPESRSFSAMAISRPRKLHDSFLQYQLLMSQTSSPNTPEQPLASSSMYATPSPLKDSWLTSSIPINVPKYGMYQEGFRVSHRDLETPEIDHKTFVNYGEGEDYQPLRITFATDHLLNHKKRHKSSINRKPVTLATISRIEALIGDVLPAVSEIWAGALSIIPSVDNIFPVSFGGSSDDTCGEAKIPSNHRSHGVENTDTLIYVTVDGSQCYNDANARGIISSSAVCSFDQHLRPISANVDVCLSNIDVASGEVSEIENLHLTSTLTVEVGKLLGMSPSLFHHFRSSETGQPLGSTEKKVTCVNGTELTLSVPNVLQSIFDHGVDALGNGGWEVITPTVQQVIRNHYDCQSLSGARLSQESDSSSCFGDSFDPRYHFDEDFTPTGGSADMAFSLTPLTLALLEDSGWYRANFEKSTAPLFGRGAGCGFLEGNCIGESKNTVPDYSKGFFCSDITEENDYMLFDPQPLEPSGCDYTYNHKADCLSLGGDESDAVCPMRIANMKSCSDKANSPSLAGEIYSPNSRCFVTDTPASICLESYCNSVDSKIDIVVDEKVFQCDYEGQELNLGHGYSVLCPRLGVSCPHLVCPANCSGRGVCDYCQQIPQCVCDDPFDESPGCFGDYTSADAPEKDADKVSVESMMKSLAQLKELAEENERELREDDKIISSLQKKHSTMKKLSRRIDESEDNERELREDNEFLSNLHNQQVSQLVDVSESNHRELGENDAVISHLQQKQSIMNHLSYLVDASETNEFEPREDAPVTANMHKKQSAIKKLSQLIAQSVGNERELREENAVTPEWHEKNIGDKTKVSLLGSQIVDKNEETEEQLGEESEEIRQSHVEALNDEAQTSTQLKLQELKEEIILKHNETTISLLDSQIIDMREENEEQLWQENDKISKLNDEELSERTKISMAQ